MDNIVDFIMP